MTGGVVNADGTMLFDVPGIVFYECLDPQATNVPAEEGWPRPASIRRRGHGATFTFCVTAAQRTAMLEWIVEFAESQISGTDPENRGRMRRVHGWAAERLEAVRS